MRSRISSASPTPPGTAMMRRPTSCEELAARARSSQGEPGHAVLIALDGENAWEHYPFNGYYFLKRAVRAPRGRIRRSSSRPCRSARRAAAARRTADAVVAGSWVHGTLATWMGDAAKNAGLGSAVRGQARIRPHERSPAKPARAARRRRAAARAVRELRLVLVVRRLQSR